MHRLSFGMPNCLLSPFSSGTLMGKILAAAPAAILIQVNLCDRSYLSSILNQIDNSIRATARSITRTKLSDKIKSDVVLSKAGLKSLTEAVSITIASSIWKARNAMNPPGHIFENKLSLKNTRSMSWLNLCQPVPGHPEAAANKLSQVWNAMNLRTSNSLRNSKTLARECHKNNAT